MTKEYFMKKLLAVLFVAAAFVAGAFAEDGFPSGSWIDENWNGEWVISADGAVKLNDSVTGELIYDFTDDKTTEKKLDITDEGAVYSFSCAETHRSYSFIKGLTVSADLVLRVNPDWSEDDYQTTIKFKKPELPELPKL